MREKILSDVTKITPDMAAGWLATNKLNRNQRPALVDKYARDMRNGHWQLNGEPIIFDLDGNLIEGQHRLAACVKAGVAFHSLVIRNVDASAVITMNTGKSRSPSDMIKIRFGASNYFAAAAACTLIFRHKNGGGMHTRHVRPSHREIEDVYANHPTIDDACGRVANVSHLLTTAIAAACYVLFSEQSKKKADEFFARLADGVNLTEDNPILMLRNRLMQLRARRDRYGFESTGVSRNVPIALTLKAWNAFRKGNSLRTLAYRVGDTFPTIGSESLTIDIHRYESIKTVSAKSVRAKKTEASMRMFELNA